MSTYALILKILMHCSLFLCCKIFLRLLYFLLYGYAFLIDLHHFCIYSIRFVWYHSFMEQLFF